MQVIEREDLFRTAGMFYQNPEMMNLYVFLSTNFIIYKSRNLRAVMVLSRAHSEFMARPVPGILEFPGLVTQMNRYFSLNES